MSLFCLSGCQGGSGEWDVGPEQRGGARARVIKTNRMSQGRKNIPLKFMFYFSTSIDNILIEMIWETRAEILDARQTVVLFLELKVCESKKWIHKNRIAELEKKRNARITTQDEMIK